MMLHHQHVLFLCSAFLWHFAFAEESLLTSDPCLAFSSAETEKQASCLTCLENECLWTGARCVSHCDQAVGFTCYSQQDVTAAKTVEDVCISTEAEPPGIGQQASYVHTTFEGLNTTEEPRDDDAMVEIDESCFKHVACVPCVINPLCTWTNSGCVVFDEDSMEWNFTSSELCEGEAEVDDDVIMAIFGEVASAVESARENGSAEQGIGVDDEPHAAGIEWGNPGADLLPVAGVTAIVSSARSTMQGLGYLALSGLLAFNQVC